MQAIIHKKHHPLGDEIPAALHAVVEKGLEKDPAERYQSMREMGSTCGGSCTRMRKWPPRIYRAEFDGQHRRCSSHWRSRSEVRCCQQTWRRMGHLGRAHTGRAAADLSAELFRTHVDRSQTRTIPTLVFRNDWPRQPKCRISQEQVCPFGSVMPASSCGLPSFSATRPTPFYRASASTFPIVQLPHHPALLNRLLFRRRPFITIRQKESEV